MLIDLGPDDTVIVPSFTFTTSALAFARQGARILFCDIEPRTLGLDPEHLAELLDDSVRAVVLVHYAGIACDVAGVRKVLTDRPDVAVVEDAAHALFGRWGGEPLGSLGRMASLSFHETKNFVCGEGGALLLNDPRDVDRARVLYDKGTDRRAFLLGQVDKYSWRDTGSSFGMSDALAAYLTAQLEQAETIQAKRRRRVRDATSQRCRRPRPSSACGSRWCRTTASPAWHLFHVLHARPRHPHPGDGADCRTRASRRPSTTCRCTTPTAAAVRRARGRLPGDHRRERAAAAAAVPQHADRGTTPRGVRRVAGRAHAARHVG